MKHLLLVLSWGICLSGFGQQVNLNEYFKDWKPRNIGPSSMSGRIVAIDAVQSNPNIIYLGAASGGVWKTESGGQEWAPVFEDQPTLNIGSIAIQQSNPDVVWVGTGEGNPRNSVNLGEGIFKTLDGGKTWKKMGLEKTRNIYRIVIDPTDPNIVYAAAIGNPFAPHPERGVYKTTDGGETWNKILFTNDTSGCADLVMDPHNPNKLIAAMWQHYRRPWTFTSGGEGSGLYITLDKGKTWKKLEHKDGLPEGPLGRIGIAFARSMPGRVYAKVEATHNGFYRSDDGGFHWELVNSDPGQVTDRPFYYQQIYVDPQNENRIYDIHSTVTFSVDGGKSFSTMIPYSGIHPDHHAWWINPNDGNFILDGNDGGIGISRDRGANWTFDEKIPVGQFYHVNVDNDLPYHVMGGMQDNGSWRGPGYTWIDGGIRNFFWENIGGGDGFDAMADPQNPDWVYAMSQQGYVNRLNISTGERWFIRPFSTDMNTKLRFNWNSAMAQDPQDPATIYFGSQFLYKSSNRGASWETISPDLSTNNPEQQKQDETGGLTLDITGAENYNTILTIAPSPLQKGLIWVGTDDGNVQLTLDGGKSWTNFRGKIPGMPIGAWVPQIRASRYHAGEAFVVCNDYRRGDFHAYIFRTTDYGKTWTRLVDDHKVNDYALCIIQDPVEPNLLFVGTEHGLWVSLDNGNSFQAWKNGYPAVSTYDLAIQEREADLAIASFGRSLWILDDIRPLRELARNKGMLPHNLTVFAAPDAYEASYRSSPGYEWSVKGLWEGPNRPRGASISFFIRKLAPKHGKQEEAKAGGAKPPAETEAEAEARGGRRGAARQQSGSQSGDTVRVQIYNDQHELIRNLRWEADSGFNRQYWGLEEKGYRRPGAPKPRPGAPEPGGEEVVPGTYTVVLTYNKETDSCQIQVKSDPRYPDHLEAKKAQRALMMRLQKSGDKLNEAMDRMTEAEEVCKKIQNQLQGIKGPEADTLRKLSKTMLDSLKSIREFINGKTINKQGLARSSAPTVLSRYREAAMYIGAREMVPGEQEIDLVKNAESVIRETLDKTNAFFSGPWAGYQKMVEAHPIDLFKKYTPIE